MSINRLSLNALVPSLLMLLGACATHQDQRDLAISIDAANDMEVQMIKQEAKEEISLLPKDLSLMTLNERNEKELLQNLENELRNESLRMPAATEEAKTPSAAYKYQYSAPIALSAEEMTQLLFNADKVTIQKGDSLSGLAERHLGNKKDWNRIWALNPNIHNPNVVEVGAKVFVPRNDMRSLASTQEVAKTPTAPVAAAPKAVATAPLPTPAPAAKSAEAKTAKEIPQLAPEVKVQAATSKMPFATEKVPTQDKVDEKATEIKVKAEATEAASANGNSFHTKEELLQEHVNTKNQSQNADKNAPEKNARTIASTAEAATEAEAAPVATAPKNLTRIVGFMGFALFLAVMGGFFFSKPNKNS